MCLRPEQWLGLSSAQHWAHNASVRYAIQQMLKVSRNSHVVTTGSGLIKDPTYKEKGSHLSKHSIKSLNKVFIISKAKNEDIAYLAYQAITMLHERA